MKKIKIKKSPGSKPSLPYEGYAFVFGNGTSRKGLDIKSLGDWGITVGCNWFFKEEFRPHILVCSDEPMTKTVLKTSQRYPKANWMISWFPKPGSGVKKATCPEKFAAGPMGAEYVSNVYRSKKVFLIGMDFFGFGSNNKHQNGMMNNLYQGKKHYAKEPNAGAPTYRNWQRRYEWILKNYPNTDFYHVNPFDGKSPERLRGYDNFHQITWDNLMDHLENDAELVDILEKTEEDKFLITTLNEDDLRACIERQIAGQENIIFNDLLKDQQVLHIRKKASEAYAKNPKQYATMNIAGFDILLPQLGAREGNIVRPLSDLELISHYEKEKAERARLKHESGIIGVDLKPGKPKKEPNGFNDLPLPPPPPSI